MRSLIFLASFFTLTGCMSVAPTTPKLTIVDYPPLQAATTVNLGDTVVKKGKRYTYDGIMLITPISKNPGLQMGYEIPAQKLAATYEDKNFVYYRANRMVQKDLMLGTTPSAGGICISKKDPTKILVYLQTSACVLKVKEGVVIEPTTVVAETSPGFVQELIYNGRVGDNVKFLYREFSQDIARPAFTQEIQYDLQDDEIIGFKNVRIRIIEADNTKLTYQVLSSFPDSL